MPFPTKKFIKILVDMDGVVADCEGKIIENYKKQNPNSPVIPDSERKGLYVDQQYKEKFGEKIGDLVFQTLCEPGFFESLRVPL